MVRITNAFRFSPDGIRVVAVPVGAEVDGRAAEVALAAGWARPAEPEARAVVEAPRRAAVPAAPRNKARGA